MSMRFTVVAGLLVGLVGLTACGTSEACLEFEPSYAGTRAGTLQIKARGPSGSSGMGGMAVQGPFDLRSDLQGSESCVSGELAPEPGWRVVAWLDVDGDEAAACSTFPQQDEACAPDAHDPVGVREFTYPDEGRLRLHVELRDP